MTTMNYPSETDLASTRDPSSERPRREMEEVMKSKEQDQDQETVPSNPHTPDHPVAEEVSGLKLWMIMGGVTLTCFLMLLDTSILVTAIPHITSQFHSLADVGWYGAAYQLSSAALQPLSGKIYVNFDSKWTFISFLVIFEIGSLLCAVAVSSNMLIIGRAVAGMGTSGILNGAFTIIAVCAPMYKRPMLIGIATGIAQLGLVLGPLIGGALTQYTTWRWCFYINLPLGGIVAVLLLFATIPEQISKPKPGAVLRDLHNKMDLVGFAIFAPATVMLLLALQYGGNEYAWNSSVVIGLFCGAAAMLLVFLAWDYYKKDEAMIPFSMVRRRIVWSSCLFYGLLMSTMFCTSYYLPIYFQGVKGASPTLSGVYLLPSIISQLICAVVSGKLVGKLGYYLPFGLVGAVLMSVGYGLLSTLTPHTPTGEWIGYQILFGAGRGLGLQIPLIAVQNTLSPPQIPIAMALVMFSASFGGAMWLSFSATIFTNSLQSLIPKYAPGVNTQAVVDAGATKFRSILSGADLSNVLTAYVKSIDRIFYFLAASAAVCFVCAWGMGWKDVRRKASSVPKV